MNEKILVFIPMYNCEQQISRVLMKFDDTACNIFSEILIIDNGSTDESLHSARQAAEELENIKITIVQNVENYSLGGSHKVAFNYAIEKKFDYIVVLHGDDQGDIRNLTPQILWGKHTQVDCLLGARFMEDSELVNYSWIRIFGNWLFNIIASFICMRKLYDLGSGLNMYKISFLKPRFYLRFPNNLYFNYYMIYYTIGVKAKFCFFPLTWREEGQVSNANLVNVGLNFLKLSLKFIFTRSRFMSEYHHPKQDYAYKIYFSHHL